MDEYWTVGNRVFAFWDEDEYFYPATITEIDGEDIGIRYDTGEEEWTTADYIEEFNVDVDEEVECKSAEDGQYYDVVVLEVDGEKIEVEFEDGTTEWSTFSKVRFFVEEE